MLPPSNVTLKQLRGFVAVADCHSFTEAASQLSLTQSAVSLLVRELEKELGLVLLERTTRRVRLSPGGLDLYPQARRILADVDAATISAMQLLERKRGVVRVAATGLYSATVLPGAMAAFGRDYPGVTVRLHDMLNEDVLASVLAGTVDIGVAPQQRSPNNEIRQQPLLLDRLHLICPREHPLAAKTTVAWKDALRFPFVNPSHDYTTRLQMDLSAFSPGLVMNPIQECSFFSTVLGLIKAGLGVTALPANTIALAEPWGLAAVPLREPVIKRQVSVFTQRGQTLSPAAESLVASLRTFIESNSRGSTIGR